MNENPQDDLVHELLKKSSDLFQEAVQMALRSCPDMSPEQAADIVIQWGKASITKVAIKEYTDRGGKLVPGEWFSIPVMMIPGVGQHDT